MIASKHKTKKSARSAGLIGDWSIPTLRRALIPKIGETPLRVKDEDFYRMDQLEEVVSRTAASERGLAIRKGEQPATYMSARIAGACRVEYDVYRISQCRPKRKYEKRKPEKLDILKALFIVNRSAKRYRDAASQHYRMDQHGLARHCSWEKQRLYAMKDKGISFAFSQGLLKFTKMHGGFGVFEGGGYTFHSTRIPRNVPTESSPVPVAFTRESQPKEKGEGRLVDATETLSSIPDSALSSTVPIPREPVRREREDEEHEGYWHDLFEEEFDCV